jgi:uncharacterized pyridoxamine 5'-phosphate oxidase family protein
MRESPEDVARLEALIDASFERAGPHLLSIYRPDRRLSAGQVVALFAGARQIAVATVTASGEPRVAPVDAILLRGRFHFGTSATAARIRHLRRRPAISLSYFERDDIAVIVHGRAILLEYGQSDFEELDRAFIQIYGGAPSTPEEGVVFVRVEPETMFTFAQRPKEVGG